MSTSKEAHCLLPHSPTFGPPMAPQQSISHNENYSDSLNTTIKETWSPIQDTLSVTFSNEKDHISSSVCQNSLLGIHQDYPISIAEIRENDKCVKSGLYHNMLGEIPPLSTTCYDAESSYICNPRFMRSSLYILPHTSTMFKEISIPFVISICPMARLHDEEVKPPLSLHCPLQCKDCMAIICPFMIFTDTGQQFLCIFCKSFNYVPDSYNVVKFVDHKHDHVLVKPELYLGSYEFMLNNESLQEEKPNTSLAYIFMFEASETTMINGLFPFLCRNMLAIISFLKSSKFSPSIKVALITFNNVLHFYNLKGSSRLHMKVVSAVKDAFVPDVHSFFFSLDEAYCFFERHGENLSQLFLPEPQSDVVLGPVLKVALEALKHEDCPGKLLVFLSSLPAADVPGVLLPRNKRELLGTDYEKTVLLPQNTFYEDMINQCVHVNASVSFFFCPQQYIDVATISSLSIGTGGQIFKYTYFQEDEHGSLLLKDMRKELSDETAFCAELKISCSHGIFVKDYYGNCYKSDGNNVKICAIDCYKAVTVKFAYGDDIPMNEKVIIQAALSYTTCLGQRRLRVHNIAFNVSSAFTDVYSACDIDTVVNYLAKEGIRDILYKRPSLIRKHLLTRCDEICHPYHTTCEKKNFFVNSLELLHSYFSCLLRSDCLFGGSYMTVDDRAYVRAAVNSMDVRNTARCFYPTLLPVHHIEEFDGYPHALSCSSESLSDDGAYLLDNGFHTFFWIGRKIDNTWLNQVFGDCDLSCIESITTLPTLDTLLSRKILDVLNCLFDDYPRSIKFAIVVQGHKRELVFRQFLMDND